MSQSSPTHLLEMLPFQISGERKNQSTYHGNRVSTFEIRSHLANLDKLWLDERGSLTAKVAFGMRTAVNICLL